MKKLKIFNTLKKELKQFEDFFDDYIKDLEYASFLKETKGKMLRPALTLLTGKMNGGLKEKALWAALSIELMHNATLVHDDVVDDADLRRDKDTFRAKLGDKRAVLYGDYLLAKSLECVAKTGDVRIVDVLARTTAEMSIGEIDQLNACGVLETTEKEYLDIIHKKTATLFVCSLLAGYFSACEKCENVDLIWAIGYNLGMVFQLKDDLLDYDRNASSGKKFGNDIREQKMTLPLIFALNQVSDVMKEEVKQSVILSSNSDLDVLKVIDFVYENGGVTYTQDVMSSYAMKANDVIYQLPDGESKEALLLLSDFFAERNR